MSDESWFSTKLRFAIMVEPKGADTVNDCLFLLKAVDFNMAFNRALNVGRAFEKKYQNSLGQNVQWRFMEIISLDVIQSEYLDGREVYSELIHLSEENVIPFGVELSPETSNPFQTI